MKICGMSDKKGFYLGKRSLLQDSDVRENVPHTHIPNH